MDNPLDLGRRICGEIEKVSALHATGRIPPAFPYGNASFEEPFSGSDQTSEGASLALFDQPDDRSDAAETDLSGRPADGPDGTSFDGSEH